MRYDPIPPLCIGGVFYIMGAIFYFISWNYLPEILQKGIIDNLWILVFVLGIPIVLSGITQDEAEIEKQLERDRKIREESKKIFKKYEDMDNLKK